MAIQERAIHTASKDNLSVHRSMESTTLPPIKTAAARSSNIETNSVDYEANPAYRMSAEQSPSRNMKMRSKKKQ